jgi:type IV secretion system protein VirB5
MKRILAISLLLCTLNARASEAVWVIGDAPAEVHHWMIMSQWFEQIAKDTEMIAQQVANIEQWKRYYDTITGARGMGAILMGAGAMKQMRVLPDDYDSAAHAGGSVLNSLESIQRSMTRITNGTPMYYSNVDSLSREMGFSQASYNAGKYRAQRMEQLIGQIQTTKDPKDIAELHARIDGEMGLQYVEKMKDDALWRAQDTERRMLEQQQQDELMAWGDAPIQRVKYR